MIIDIINALPTLHTGEWVGLFDLNSFDHMAPSLI